MTEMVFTWSGVELGRVRWAAGTLVPTRGLESVVDSWLAADRPEDEFMEFYDGWSNGYVTAAAVE